MESADSRGVQRMLRDKSPSTIEQYRLSLKRFESATGMGPDVFLDFYKKADPIDGWEQVEKVADQFPPAAGIKIKSAVRSLLRHSGLNQLPKTRLAYHPVDWHRGYRKPEISRLLSYLDAKHHKLAVTMIAETGFRAEAALGICWKHISEDYEAGLPELAVRFPQAHYYRRKSPGFSFLGQHSIGLIRELVAEKEILPEPEKRLIRISYDAVYRAIVHASVKTRAGLDEKIQPLHGLRKYFEDALDQAGLDLDVKRTLEGHFVDSRAKHYSSREWDRLRESYRKAYSFIDWELGAAPELSTKVLSIEAENRQLKQRLEEVERRGVHLVPGDDEKLDWIVENVGIDRDRLIAGIVHSVFLSPEEGERLKAKFETWKEKTPFREPAPDSVRSG